MKKYNFYRWLNKYKSYILIFCLIIVCLSFGIWYGSNTLEGALLSEIVLKVKHGPVEYHLIKADRFYRDNVDLARATEEYKKVLALEPENIEAIKSLASIYLAQAGIPIYKNKAIVQLSYIISLEPDNKEAKVALVTLLASGPNHEYQKALELITSTNLDNTNMLMGWVSLASGDIDNAIYYFHTVCIQKPADPLSHYYLGLAYYEKGNFTDAIINMKKAEILQGGLDPEAEFILSSDIQNGIDNALTALRDGQSIINSGR